jgi:hypothetical protein
VSSGAWVGRPSGRTFPTEARGVPTAPVTQIPAYGRIPGIFETPRARALMRAHARPPRVQGAPGGRATRGAAIRWASPHGRPHTPAEPRLPCSRRPDGRARADDRGGRPPPGGGGGGDDRGERPPAPRRGAGLAHRKALGRGVARRGAGGVGGCARPRSGGTPTTDRAPGHRRLLLRAPALAAARGGALRAARRRRRRSPRVARDPGGGRRVAGRAAAPARGARVADVGWGPARGRVRRPDRGDMALRDRHGLGRP